MSTSSTFSAPKLPSKDNTDFKAAELQRKINETKGIMENNVDKALKNSERIEVLVDQGQQMTDNAERLNRNAGILRRQYCWKM